MDFVSISHHLFTAGINCAVILQCTHFLVIKGESGSPKDAIVTLTKSEAMLPDAAPAPAVSCCHGDEQLDSACLCR